MFLYRFYIVISSAKILGIKVHHVASTDILDFHSFFYFYTSGRTSSYLSVLGDSVRKKSFRFWRYNRFWLLFSFRWDARGAFCELFRFYFSTCLYMRVCNSFVFNLFTKSSLIKKKVELSIFKLYLHSNFIQVDVIFVQVTNIWRKKIKVLKIMIFKRNFSINKYSIYNIYSKQGMLLRRHLFYDKDSIDCHILR